MLERSDKHLYPWQCFTSPLERDSAMSDTITASTALYCSQTPQGSVIQSGPYDKGRLRLSPPDSGSLSFFIFLFKIYIYIYIWCWSHTCLPPQIPAALFIWGKHFQARPASGPFQILIDQAWSDHSNTTSPLHIHGSNATMACYTVLWISDTLIKYNKQDIGTRMQCVSFMSTCALTYSMYDTHKGH